MRMRNRYKIILWLVFTLIVLFLIILISLGFNNTNYEIKYEIVDKIVDYNYTLEDRDSELMSETFKNLKSVLSEKIIDYDLYAEYLSELFVIDLFTLNNKNNKYDVGSSEYVFSEAKENYTLKVEDTLYKYIVDINSDERLEYPVVSSITKENIEKITYTYNDKEYDGYEIKLTWEYVKNFDYQNEGKVTIIKDNNKLYVVSFEGV